MSEALELLGVACLAVFAAVMFGWPFALLPVGVFALVAGFGLDSGPKK
jgi:hypothetical protein